MEYMEKQPQDQYKQFSRIYIVYTKIVMHSVSANVKSLLSTYSETKNAELELRFDASQIKKDWYINMMRTGIELGTPTIEQSINLISDTKSGYYAQRIMYVDGKKQPNTLKYEKNVIGRTKMNRGLIPYKVVLATENTVTQIDMPSTMARVKLRLSIEDFPKLEGWRIDFTFTKQIRPVITSQLIVVRDRMFKVGDAKTFIENAPWTDADKYEIEVEHIAPGTAVTSDEISNVVETLYKIVTADHVQLEGYQSVIYEIAKHMLPPQRAELFRVRFGLKQLYNQVKEMNRTDYFTTIFPKIQQYCITIKAEGNRVIGYAVKKVLKIIGHELIEIPLENAVTGPLIVDAEYIDGKLMVFDVMVINGVNISNKPSTERFSFINAAVLSLNKNAIPKEYVYLTSNWANEIRELWGKKYTYEVDGIIFNSISGTYKSMQVWKWKPVEKMSPDLMTMKAPVEYIATLDVDKRAPVGTTLMILFCSIGAGQFKSSHIRKIPFYNTMFPNQSMHDTFPIQFSTPDEPLVYLYYLPDDSKVATSDELHGRIGEYNYDTRNQQWNLMRIREDRDIDVQRGLYFGNNFHVALVIWNNFQNPLTIDNITSPNPSTMGYFAKQDSNEHKSVRNFNSFVKTMAMTKYFTNVEWLVDCAAGQGQDMFKMSKIGVQNALLMDIDKNALSTVSSRMFSHKKNVGHLNTRIFTKHIDLSEPYLDNMKKLTMLPKGGVSSVQCNFAIHYFMNSKNSIKNFVNMVSTLLSKNNGTFMFTCFNGRTIFDMLTKKKEGEAVNYVDNEITKFSVKRMYTSNQFMEVGQKIGVILPFSLNNYYDEYLVNIDYVLGLLREVGFKTVLNKGFATYLSEYAVNNERGFKAMTEEDKKFASLYQVVVVQRSGSTKGGMVEKKSPLVEDIVEYSIKRSGRPQLHNGTIHNKWFKLIVTGEKIIECRLNRGKYSKIRTGDIVTFANITTKKEVVVKVVRVQTFETFDDMFGTDGINVADALPGIENPSDAAGMYHKIYTPTLIKKCGVLALHISTM